MSTDEKKQSVIDEFQRIYYAGSTWQHTYWRGVPVRKCPLDLWIYQEIFHEVQPDVIIECGTYLGGSAYYFSALCEVMRKGRILTIDVELHQRPTWPRVTFYSGNSVSPKTLAVVRNFIKPNEKVLVILDSCHERSHVLAEMKLYAPLVTSGSYLIVEDGNINGHPVFPEHGPGPYEAISEFMAECHDFTIDREREKFMMTMNPNGYLKRK